MIEERRAGYVGAGRASRPWRCGVSFWNLRKRRVSYAVVATVALLVCCTKPTARERTAYDLLLLGGVVQTHANEYGSLPRNDAELVEAWRKLTAPGGSLNVPSRAWDGLRSAISVQEDSRDSCFVDAWGYRIIYRFRPSPPILLGAKYDLYSVGPDGMDNRGRRDDVLALGTGEGCLTP